MNGMRRALGVRRRSDQAPTGGWMKRAAILSSGMKKLMKAGRRRNLSARKTGTKALYTLQMTLIPKKSDSSKKSSLIEFHCESPLSLRRLMNFLSASLKGASLNRSGRRLSVRNRDCSRRHWVIRA